MAKDVLVTEVLSDQMSKAGAKLVERLDAVGSEVKSAFWLFLSEEKTWKLILASPLVGSEGPRNFYKKVIKYLFLLSLNKLQNYMSGEII